jgi:hypothetical protein
LAVFTPTWWAARRGWRGRRGRAVRRSPRFTQQILGRHLAGGHESTSCASTTAAICGRLGVCSSNLVTSGRSTPIYRLWAPTFTLLVDRRPDSPALKGSSSRRRETTRQLAVQPPGPGSFAQALRANLLTNDAQAGSAGDAQIPDTPGGSGLGSSNRHAAASVRASSSRSTGNDEPMLSAVAWTPGAEMSAQKWAEFGQRLGRLGDANWWLGDWVRYGNAQYGKRYKLAANLTGYDPQTLMNYGYVASRFGCHAPAEGCLVEPPRRTSGTRPV